MSDIATREVFAEMVSLPHLNLLHYLLSETGGEYVAHCLDLDLVATGSECNTAVEKLDRLVKATIELALATQQFANLATSAPETFWKDFSSGMPVELPSKTLRITIPRSVQIVPVSESEINIVAARAAHAA